VAIAHTAWRGHARVSRDADAAPDLRAVNEEALNALGYWYLRMTGRRCARDLGLEAEIVPESRFAHTGLARRGRPLGMPTRRTEARLRSGRSVRDAAEILRRASR
jgi:hypothetical protein